MADSTGIAEADKLSTDINDQATNLEKGLTSMPLDVAADSIKRWKSTLESTGDSKLSAIGGKLGDLHSALTGGTPDGKKVGPLLTELGTHVDSVAGSQSGSLKMALTKLGSALTKAGSSL